MDIATIISYITSPELQQKLFLVKVVFIGFSTFFAVVIVNYLFRTEWARELFVRDIMEFFSGRAYREGRLARQWESIKRRLEIGTEPERKLAIMEAEDLIDDVLRKMGYVGETLVERLEQLTTITISNLEQLKEVHSVRDNIVHDPDYHLTLEQARDALDVYERALLDLEAI